VAQIVTDINAYIAVDADGQTTFNIAQFMIAAAPRLAAIPDPGFNYAYNTPELLRSVNVRPFAATLLADLNGIAETNVGTNDIPALLLDLEAKAAAVTKYYDAAYSEKSADLAIASLSSGPIHKNMPDAEDTTKETRYYRTTFVDDWSVESAPSEVSAAVEVGPKDTVTVTVGTVPTGRDITHWRGYRSNSGNETADFQYVPYPTDDNGVPIASTTVTDNVKNSALQEICPTTIWDEPPSNLQGLVGMANGIHLGFFGNTLCPSINYKPWAYPEDYRLTVGWPIVGLAAWGQSAFVGTRGKPYFVHGTDAASLSAEVLDSNQACVSARSICATEAGVVYASPDGLCLATPGGVRILTERHFTSEEWRALGPETMIVQEHDGAIYIFKYDIDPAILADYAWAVMSSGGSGTTLTNGNQRFNFDIARAGSGNNRSVRTNTALSGKVYCEFQLIAQPGDLFSAFGIHSGATDPNAFYNTGNWDMFDGNGGCGLPAYGLYSNGVQTSSASYAFGTADRIGVAVDMSAGKIWYRRNGSWINGGDPAAGTSPSQTFTPGAGSWYWYGGYYSCNVSSGVASMDIFPNAGTQSYAAPSGFTPYQP
jgi:hypothetical protein